MEAETFAMKIGGKIRFLRGKRSRDAFARELGIHKNTLANYERGKRTPDSDFLVVLCRSENIDPAWLLGGPKRTDRVYNRELLERVGNVLARLVPGGLGGKTGKLLVNIYERAIEIEAADRDIETITAGMLELVELSPEPSSLISGVMAEEEKSWRTG